MPTHSRRLIYEVYVTPASGVGGEWPRPARISSIKAVAERYAAACRGLGQLARVRVREKDRS